MKKISSFYYKILKENEARLKLFLGESGKLCRISNNEALYTGGFTGMQLNNYVGIFNVQPRNYEPNNINL